MISSSKLPSSTCRSFRSRDYLIPFSESGEVVSNIHPLNIENILKNISARKGYWRNLGSSQDFANRTLESCVTVIHEDIITVWNFDDRGGVGHPFICSVLFAEGNQYLFSREFTATMTHLVEDADGMSEVEHMDNHTDLEESYRGGPKDETVTHTTSRTPPEESGPAGPSLGLYETSTHTALRTPPEERSRARSRGDSNLALEETSTLTASRAPPEERSQGAEGGANLASDETFAHAASINPSEESSRGGPKDETFTNVASRTHSDERSHATTRALPEERSQDSHNLALDETFSHAASRTHSEERPRGSPNLALDETVTHAASESRTPPEESSRSGPNLDLEETLTHAVSRTHSEERSQGGHNLALDVIFTPMAPWANSSYQNKSVHPSSFISPTSFLCSVTRAFAIL